MNGALRWPTVLVVVVVAFATTTSLVHSFAAPYSYDDAPLAAGGPPQPAASALAEQALRGQPLDEESQKYPYDAPSDLTGTSARPAGAASAPNTAGLADDVLTPRPSFRTGTVDDAWANATPGPNGGRLCPTCGDELMVPPRSGPRDWDIDHQPPWSQRTGPMSQNPNLTRADVIDEYQRGTRLECPGCNRGRGARPL